MLRSTQNGPRHPGLAAHHGAALLLRPLQGDQTLGAFPHRVPHQVSATYYFPHQVPHQVSATYYFPHRVPHQVSATYHTAQL